MWGVTAISVDSFFYLTHLQWMYKTNFRDISSTGVVVLPESAKLLALELNKAMAEGGITAGHH